MPRTYNPQKTRDRLLDAAFEEIWRSGYQSASLDEILGRTQLTKGALYHHFGDKQRLAYAVVDIRLRAYIHSKWIKRLEQVENPIDELINLLERNTQHLSEPERDFGCPLTKLGREMAQLDKGFYTRIEKIHEEWREAVIEALRRGQLRGYVLHSLDLEAATLFIIAAIQGLFDPVYMKAENRRALLAVEALKGYLDSLRGETEHQVYESRWSDFID